MNEYDIIIDRIKKGRRFLVVSHYNPDGDAIGSTIAFGIILKRMGKTALLYNRDAVPDNLKFLPMSNEFVHKLSEGESFDLGIMVDCAQRKRISADFAKFKGCREVACIDHHILETPDADFKLLDSDAASTGEVVMRIAKKMGEAGGADIAQCIYTTIVVDTGFFKYSNTNAGIFSLAAGLVKEGADPWTVAKNLEESYSMPRMKLLGSSLESLKIELGGRYATMDVTQQMLKKSGATMDLSDEYATYPRSILGVEVSALFREQDDGIVKVSMRSKDHVDVASIAAGFGGGGHARAAGCQLRTTLNDAKGKIMASVKDKIK